MDRVSCMNEDSQIGGGGLQNYRRGMEDGVTMITATVDGGPETTKRGQENRFMAGKISTTGGTGGSSYGGGYGKWAGNKREGKVVVNKGREPKKAKLKKDGHGGNPYYISHMKQNTYTENLANQFQYKSPLSNL
jgi:hypothetical protein